MRLRHRVADLERRISGAGVKRWVRIFQYENQTEEQAVAAYERENGPIDDSTGVVVRVIINKPSVAGA
jgi:hypothetical protein